MTENIEFTACFLNRFELMQPFSELEPLALLAYHNDFMVSEDKVPAGKLLVRVYEGGAKSQQAIAWLSTWMEWMARTIEDRSDMEVVVYET